MRIALIPGAEYMQVMILLRASGILRLHGLTAQSSFRQGLARSLSSPLHVILAFPHSCSCLPDGYCGRARPRPAEELAR